MTATKLRQLRQRSRWLFGAQYRVEVGAAIASGDGVVCIKDLAEELGDPPGMSSVNAELKVLERAGLLVRAPRQRGERRVYLLRQPSSYWGLCRELHEATRPSSRLAQSERPKQ
jgi:DNA-binding MarR family transcriptional regulator